MIHAIARHHAYWWNSDRFASLPWPTTYNNPPFPRSSSGNFEAAWPNFIQGFGSDFSRRCAPSASGFVVAAVVLTKSLRPPHTFLHGDLRLDQLFFAVGADDPPVTVLDWQMTAQGRGAYDLGYFLSQSLILTPGAAARKAHRALRGTPRRTRNRLSRMRIAARLSAHRRVVLPLPSLGEGRIEMSNERQLDLIRTMFNRCVAAIEDNGALSLRPD